MVFADTFSKKMTVEQWLQWVYNHIDERRNMFLFETKGAYKRALCKALWRMVWLWQMLNLPNIFSAPNCHKKAFA